MNSTQQPETSYAEVFTSGETWIVRYCSGPMKARVRALFGSHELPTAFTLPMTVEEVIAELRAIPANAHTCFVPACSAEEQRRRGLAYSTMAANWEA